MTRRVLHFRSRFPVPASLLFQWHARPGAFQRLAPPWEDLDVVRAPASITDGSRAIFRVPAGPVSIRWVAEHRDYVEGVQFRDVQLQGPFARWEHTHRVEADGPDHAYLDDFIEYEMPLGPLGDWLGNASIRDMMSHTFAYRHATTARDLSRHATRLGMPPWRVAVSGAGGLVGSSLVPFLTTGGHDVTKLRRDKDSSSPILEEESLESVDAVIHLAGEPIDGRWTPAKKERIRTSRLEGTRQLCERLARLGQPPRTLLCASAVGVYGDRGDETLTEESATGTGFLAEVGRGWEAACEPARQAGIRVVHLRFGVILSPRGGALRRMLLPFRLGLGGRIGSGRLWFPWIALDDVLGVIHHCLADDRIDGPVNVVAPQQTTNADFTAALGRVLRRPTIFPVPAWGARFALGEMADALLLSSNRVEPRVLQRTDYHYDFPDLDVALRQMLGKNDWGETQRG
jgi:uncharacterized protein (TIGR01777 family)